MSLVETLSRVCAAQRHGFLMSDLYVEVNGNGPDLVLLHGWGLNVRVWDGLVEELRDRFRLIAVDLPGHGKSPWTPGRITPAEQAWLLHSTLAPISNRYSLLGWSLGGQIALDLAAAMPAQIDKLVLVATTPRFTAAPDWPYGMKLEVITKMATQLREDYQQTVRDFLDLQVRGSMDGTSVVEQLRHALSVHGEAKPEALEAGLNTLATSDLQTDASACADTDVGYRRTKRSDHRARCVARVGGGAARRAIRRDAPRRARAVPFASKGIHRRAGAVSARTPTRTHAASRWPARLPPQPTASRDARPARCRPRARRAARTAAATATEASA